MFIAEIKELIYPIWNCMDVLLVYSIILSKCHVAWESRYTAFSRQVRLHCVHFSHDSGAGFANVWAFA